MWLETEVGRGQHLRLHGADRRRGRRRTPMRRAADAGLPVVVVVDDDRASLDLMTAYLDGLGVRVVRARNGTKGSS